MTNNNEQFTYLKDYKPFPYQVLNVELCFEIEKKGTKLISKINFAPNKQTLHGEALILDGDELMLKSILLNGSPLSSDKYKLSSNKLEVFSPPKEKFLLEIITILDPDDNSELMGLYRSSGVYCTQCEPEGFRRMTYFPDRPDVLSTYKVRIEADKQLLPVLLSNGNLIEKGELENNRHYVVWEDPHKKPSYLFAIVAGDLGKIEDEFITMSGKKIDLAIYCEHGKESKCTYAMDALIRSMKWDEKRFGREYDLDIFNIVAVSDFNFGAMENKGLNIFNDRLILADQQSATDRDYGRIESVVAHEYFHNWTGNRITCRDWFQLCLKEGLTVYRDQEFTSDERSRSVKRIEDVRLLRMAQFPEDAGPLAHPARPSKFREIDNFYTATVYEKGAEIVRMLALILGRTQFRKGCDLYFERHDGEATTIEAWLAIFEETSGQDLSQFGKWYLQAGTPNVSVKTHWNEATGSFTLSLNQHTKPTPDQSEKVPMLIPIKFGLVGANGGGVGEARASSDGNKNNVTDMSYSSVSGGTIKDDIILFNSEKMELKFEGLASRPVLSLLREFSAPINIVSEAKTDDRLFLARHDSDAFNRWQALNDVALELLVSAVKNNGKYKDEHIIEKYLLALKEVIENPSLDDALKAFALSLPSEIIIAQELKENIDPLLIHQVRQGFLHRIGNAQYMPILAKYNILAIDTKIFSTSAKATRARALRNQCLALINASGKQQAQALIIEHYFSANNMSDRLAALSSIISQGNSDASKLLQDFYDRYCDDILVYDKWLSLNAIAPDENCLKRVRNIYNSSKFPKSNPNRLSALVGSFARANMAQFTQVSGDGFSFVIDVIKEIDKINPQSSASLLSAFKNWKAFEPIRKEKARLALEVLKKETLSNNLSDILQRLLA